MIDEKKLIEDLSKWKDSLEDPQPFGEAGVIIRNVIKTVIDIINDQPTIQPQGNRGKWIRYEDTHENSVKYICPFCGDYTAFRGEISESTVNGNYIYCRHCGAKNGEDQ